MTGCALASCQNVLSPGYGPADRRQACNERMGHRVLSQPSVACHQCLHRPSNTLGHLCFEKHTRRIAFLEGTLTTLLGKKWSQDSFDAPACTA